MTGPNSSKVLRRMSTVSRNTIEQGQGEYCSGVQRRCHCEFTFGQIEDGTARVQATGKGLIDHSFLLTRRTCIQHVICNTLEVIFTNYVTSLEGIASFQVIKFYHG